MREKKKTIQVSEDDWKWMSHLKTKYALKSLDKVVFFIRRLIFKLNLQKDLEILIQKERKNGA